MNNKNIKKIISINLIPSTNFLYPIQLVSEAVMLEAGAKGIKDDSNTYNFVLAVEEIITNILKHGRKKKKGLFSILIKYIINNKKVTVKIHDGGNQYKPPEKYDEKFVLENFSGMGLHFVRSVINEYKYEYDKEKKENIVTLVLKIKKKEKVSGL